MRNAVIFLLILFLQPLAGQTQLPSQVFVGEISVEGNKRTRSEIILRELPFQQGDSLPVEDLAGLLEKGEEFLLNTGLFNEVSINFRNWEGSTNRVHLQVLVAEAWYLYPLLIFQLADRNFNVWWVEQNRSLQRVNYGIEFIHRNTSGRRDRLRLTLQHGYTHNYGLRYTLPFLNQSQTLGFTGEVDFAQNKEVNFATGENKQLFFRDEERFIYQRFHLEGGLILRPGLQSNHLFLLSFDQNRVDERVGQELNPDFFLNGRSRQRYFSLSYLYSYENRDVRFYAWRGNYFGFVLEKNGLGIFDDRSALTAFTRYDQHLPFSDRWSLQLSLRGKLSLLRNRQPYLDSRALGFGDNTMHGFEYYIIEGLDMFIARSSLHWRLLGTEFNFGKLMPIRAFRKMPIKLFLSLNNDFGYVNDTFAPAGNFLHNTPLWGGGIGLDLLLFADKVIRLEYSINHLLERGIFLNLDLNI